MLWRGKELLIPDVTAGVIAIIDAIIALIALFTPTAVGIAYMHYNVKAKQVK
jgi:ribonuclease PH